MLKLRSIDCCFWSLKSSHTMYQSRKTFLNLCLRREISTGSYLKPGKMSKLFKSGKPSLISRDTNDSVMDRMRISCSLRLSAILDSSNCSLADINFSFTLSSITSTDLRERKIIVRV